MAIEDMVDAMEDEEDVTNVVVKVVEIDVTMESNGLKPYIPAPNLKNNRTPKTTTSTSDGLKSNSICICKYFTDISFYIHTLDKALKIIA